MNERVENSVHSKGRTPAAPSPSSHEAASDSGSANPYRRARANVLEAGLLGLCRLRVA